MEAIAPYAVLFVQLVGQTIDVCHRRYRLVESCVKHGDVRNTCQEIHQGFNALEVHRIVEWSQVAYLADILDHLVGDQHR